MCGQQKGQNRAKSHEFFVVVLFKSKGQGVISAFSKGQGVTKRGQGAAPCKRSVGRTLYTCTSLLRKLVYWATEWGREVGRLTVGAVGTQERDGESILPHVPDTERSVLSARRHNVLLGRVFVQAVERHTVARPERNKQHRISTMQDTEHVYVFQYNTKNL